DPCDSFEATITPIGDLNTASGIQFFNALPAGGSWSGDSSDGSFDPSIGEGTYSITYTVDFGQGCVKSDTITFIVNLPGNGSCTSTENLALNGTASQSSTYGFGYASYAIDDNTNGTSPWSADLQHT
ncbi:hypothetical protein, partial [Croceitalea sp. P059]|uniref:hypothetical protein n=1 Tax=Croceitalea sp. P059 TaxID=3075601 RepID=UPI0028846BDA